MKRIKISKVKFNRGLWAPIVLAPFLIIACQQDIGIDVPEASPSPSDATQDNQDKTAEYSEASSPVIANSDPTTPSAPLPSPAPEVTPTPAAPTPLIADGSTYEIKSAAEAYCLDIPNSGTTAGLQVQMYTCNETGAQAFTVSLVEVGFYKIFNRANGLALTVHDQTLPEGSALDQNSYSGAVNQLFSITQAADSQNIILKPKGSSLALEVKSSDADYSYDPLVLSPSSSSLMQQWILTAIP